MTEDIRIVDPSTWLYIKNIRESKVVNLSWFAPTGAVMYLLTMVFYILLATSFSDDRFHDLSWTLFGIHVLVGLLVIRDSMYFAGSSVVLQTAIIGLGTFNTFSLAGILGGVLARDMDYDNYAYSVVSLLLACVSNAMMIALLFAMFHKTAEKVQN